MRSNMFTGVFLTLAAIGNAYADSTICPAVADIEQVEDVEGYSYTAPGPNKRIWVGSNPYAEKEHLETFKFTGALYRDVSSEGNSFVMSCDYEGDEFLAFTRLTLYSFNDWKPAEKTKWIVQDKTATSATFKKTQQLQTCTSFSQKDCAFDYSSLSAAPKTE